MEIVSDDEPYLILDEFAIYDQYISYPRNCSKLNRDNLTKRSIEQINPPKLTTLKRPNTTHRFNNIKNIVNIYKLFSHKIIATISKFTSETVNSKILDITAKEMPIQYPTSYMNIAKKIINKTEDPKLIENEFEKSFNRKIFITKKMKDEKLKRTYDYI